MNEYEAVVEWYWQGKIIYLKKNNVNSLGQVNEWEWSFGGMILRREIDLLEEKQYKVFGASESMIMGQWRKDTNRGNRFIWRKIL